MEYLKYLMINDNWAWTAVVWVLVIALLVLLVRKWSSVSSFTGEVKGELFKASWPWESDPKIKGFRKYKELIDSTVVVLIAMVLVAGFVQFWDFMDIQIITAVTSWGR